MASTHNISLADTLLSGAAYYERYHKDALATKKGLPVNAPVLYSYGAIVGADRDGLVESVNPADGATLTLRATVTGMTNTAGVVTLDTPRNVTIYGTADESTRSALVTGTDFYGAPQTEVITGPVGNGTNKIAEGDKAFKTISSIVCTGDFGTIEVGFGTRIGLPFYVSNKNHVVPMVDGEVAAPHTLRSVITAIGTAQDTAVIDTIGGCITAIQGVSAAANATASSTVTVTNRGSLAGSLAVTTVVFANNYAAYAAQASGAIVNRQIAANSVLQVTTDGTGDGAGQAQIEIQVEPALITVGDTAAATTTTGDVRGTIDFGLIPNATKLFDIFVFPSSRQTKAGAFGVAPI